MLDEEYLEEQVKLIYLNNYVQIGSVVGRVDKVAVDTAVRDTVIFTINTKRIEIKLDQLLNTQIFNGDFKTIPRKCVSRRT